jgi:hypothetical protein
MSAQIGPTGRLYRRANHRGRWVAAMIVCLVVISVAIIGVPNIAVAFRYFGL